MGSLVTELRAQAVAALVAALDSGVQVYDTWMGAITEGMCPCVVVDSPSGLLERFAQNQAEGRHTETLAVFVHVRALEVDGGAAGAAARDLLEDNVLQVLVSPDAMVGWNIPKPIQIKRGKDAESAYNHLVVEVLVDYEFGERFDPVTDDDFGGDIDEIDIVVQPTQPDGADAHVTLDFTE